jgi:hypothetical protein
MEEGCPRIDEACGDEWVVEECLNFSSGDGAGRLSSWGGEVHRDVEVVVATVLCTPRLGGGRVSRGVKYVLHLLRVAGEFHTLSRARESCCC